MNGNKIILVSNRLPFQVVEKSGKASLSQSNGGLVSSMLSYFQKTGSAKSQNQFTEKACWVGTSDIPEFKFQSLINEKKIECDSFELAPIHLSEMTMENYYNGFCNDVIWPLFHYFPSYVKYDADYFEHYMQANKRFCEKIIQTYNPGDLIWIHDYHLMLLPEMLRKAIPDASIGFFLHIPFPSFELFRVLPNNWRTEILNGLLGADLIGFHTNDYMQHFLKSVQQILGYDNQLRQITVNGRAILVDSFPISIDFNKFHSSTNNPEVVAEKNKIKKKMEGRQVIVSVDRLDYAKAITNRLESFDLFLENNPSYKEKVTYVLVVVPSRDIIKKYKENKRDIERLISSINGKHGNIDWTPIVYQYKSIDFTQLTGLYFAADVALITPLRDGMNLVAKEFVSTRIGKRGVLILSETAGAASELNEAIIVNPTDRQQIANAILKALTMPVEEQMGRNEIMQNRIKNYDIVKWVEDFVTQLSTQKIRQNNLKIKEVTLIIEQTIISKYKTSNKRLILLDYDGTLTPFSKLPDQASPSLELMNLLAGLVEDERNEVVLISGRPKKILDSWFSNTSITIIAEHGGFCKCKGEQWIQIIPTIIDWKSSLYSIFNFYCSRCAGTFIEEKELSLAWHYRNAEKELGLLRSRELINELKELSISMNFQILDGNMVIEARANGVNKGFATQLLLNKEKYDFILAIGDDVTDEDMFKVIPENGFSVKVGLTQTQAQYNFKHQRNVIDFLQKICLLSCNLEKQVYLE